MIKKDDIIRFFDRCAPSWDAEMIIDDEITGIIMDNAGVRSGVSVLDAACGTGVLFPYYLERGVISVTGIDISPQMAKIAASKTSDSRVRVICGDVEENRGEEYDIIMLYNAFPHFPDPEHLLRSFAEITRRGGRLSIAHGMSRAKIDSHHSGAAQYVSNGLIHESELCRLMEPYFDVDIVISDDRMYQVVGTRK